MKIVLAGSRALPRRTAPRLLTGFLLGLPPDAQIRLRSGNLSTGIFEQEAGLVSELLGLEVQWWSPRDAGLRNGLYVYTGREATFARDLEMVKEVDLVLCLFTPEQIGDQTSGTVALVEKALSLERVVYGFTVHVEGDHLRAERVGEHDPSDRWGSTLQATLGA